MGPIPSERMCVAYRLTGDSLDDVTAVARDITLEQTVELPEACLRTDAERAMVGHVVSLTELEQRHWEAVISYPVALIGSDPLQLMTVLFGNISLKRGIQVASVEWAPSVLSALGGPRHGIEGLRELCGAQAGRPLLCVALKPVGLSAVELARRAAVFAENGVDIVKDDHGLADQPTAHFRDRVSRCLDAVDRANRRTGGQCAYFPNITGPIAELEERLRYLEGLGCRGVLVSPLLVGLDAVRWIGQCSTLAVLAHPALAGAYFGPTHGIAPDLLLGTIFRLVGSDGVIYPNVGGRFTFSDAECRAINTRLREPLGEIRPAFPVPGGGVDVARIPDWVRRYGPDTVFLIGASLYRQPDIGRATRTLVSAVRHSARASDT